MNTFTEWRGFDLRRRCAKIERAFNLEEVSSADDVPLIVNTPCYFAFGGRDVPEDYFTNPASMLEFQAGGYERHLASVNDDMVPYFMPWFGTGVLASAFGCTVKMPDRPGTDPSVVNTCVNSPADAARLKMPDPARDGLMPCVLDTIDYARENSDLPPGLTDMNSPFSTVCQMCGYDKLFIWMYEEPKMVHDIFGMVTQAFIEWVKLQKKHIGEPLNRSNGLQGIWAPEGVGVWVSDDDLVILGPDLYREFVVPCLSRVFEAFGGGFVHFCGKGVHQLDNIMRIKGVRGVNNSPMAAFEAFDAMYRRLSGRLAIVVQDNAPVNSEKYYNRLFERVDDFRGIMLASFALDTIAMNDAGGSCDVDWNAFDTANRVVTVIRNCVRRKLEA